MEKLSIEESFSELEKLLARMEDENTGLEESFRLYEKGLSLIKSARESIDRVEKDLVVLTDDAQPM